MQSKHESAREASAIAISNFVLTWGILLVWIETSDFLLTVVLTIKAVLVGYIIRRAFNQKVIPDDETTDNTCSGCTCPCSNSKAGRNGSTIHISSIGRRHNTKGVDNETM